MMYPSGGRFRGDWRRTDSSIMLFALVLVLLLSVGCSVFRGIPTHGGGKRFDEEQWAVAASARQSVAEMDLKELSGVRTQIVVTSIAHSGGGYAGYPRIDKVNASYSVSNSVTDYAYDYFLADPYVTPYFRNSEYDTNYRGSTFGAEVVPSFEYRPVVFSSDSDSDYLRAAVSMKALHDGVIVVLDKPDAYLYVLVDVLGTNRSRRDSLVYWKDTLKAHCALTYFASSIYSTDLKFSARQSSAAATYEESSYLGFSGYDIKRFTERLDNESLPVSCTISSE